jgi:hypothetical protein
MLRYPARTACVALLALSACASQPRSAGSSSSRTTLTSEEMQRAGYPDLFTTVQSLRPQWLQRRGQTSIRGRSDVKVYLDGSLLGGPETLRQISTRSISSIRYMNALEASERWGLDHDQGAIVISTRT